MGRFAQADTIVPPGVQGLDRYAYVNNNPVRYNDPSGHWVETAFDIISLGLSLNDVRTQGLNFWTGLAVVTDVASIALPIVPAGASHAIRAAKWSAKAANTADAVADTAKVADKLADSIKPIPKIPDDALVCRGGLCQAEQFANGSGVTIASDGTMSGVSVNSMPGATIDNLTSTIPNGQVGVTTMGDIRALGGNVDPKPLPDNPFHAEMSGITPLQAQILFTPTIKNPHRIKAKIQ